MNSLKGITKAQTANRVRMEEIEGIKIEQKPLTRIASYHNYQSKQMNKNDINFIAAKNNKNRYNSDIHVDSNNHLNINKLNYLNKSKMLCNNASQKCYFSKTEDGHIRICNSLVFKEIGKSYMASNNMPDKYSKDNSRFTNVIKEIFVPGHRKTANKSTNFEIGKISRRVENSFNIHEHKINFISPLASKSKSSKIAKIAVEEYVHSAAVQEVSSKIHHLSEKLNSIRYKNK